MLLNVIYLKPHIIFGSLFLLSVFSNAACQRIQYMTIFFASVTPFTLETSFGCFVDCMIKSSDVEDRVNICP